MSNEEQKRKVPEIETSSRSVPDPNGAPVPTSRSALETMVSLGLHAAAGGAALLVAGYMMLPCVGATRSSRLMKDQRQREAAKQIAMLQREQAVDGQVATDAAPALDASQ